MYSQQQQQQQRQRQQYVAPANAYPVVHYGVSASDFPSAPPSTFPSAPPPHSHFRTYSSSSDGSSMSSPNAPSRVLDRPPLPVGGGMKGSFYPSIVAVPAEAELKQPLISPLELSTSTSGAYAVASADAPSHLSSARRNEDPIMLIRGNANGYYENLAEHRDIKKGAKHGKKALRMEDNLARRANRNARARDKEGLEIRDAQQYDAGLAREQMLGAKAEEVPKKDHVEEYTYGGGSEYKIKEYETTEYASDYTYKSIYDK